MEVQAKAGSGDGVAEVSGLEEGLQLYSENGLLMQAQDSSESAT